MVFILIYVTHENMQEAQDLAQHLLKKKLIACANFFPIESAYWWKGEINNTNEIVSLLKTRTANWQKIKAEVKKMHPYQTPCIMKLEVEANDDYEQWIMDETK